MASWKANILWLRLLILLVPIHRLSAQVFLNGSFEFNSFTCGYNLPNFVFNQGMQGATAFGNKEEVDVLNGSCGYGPAFDGDHFIALYYDGSADAVALSLSEPLEIGSTYTLQFAMKNGLPPGSPSGKIRIGLFNQDFAFGDLLLESSPAGQLWEEITVVFQADQAYEYITAETSPIPGAWIFLDDFKFICPTIDLGRDTVLCNVTGFTMTVDPAFDKVRWSDGSTGGTFTANESGLYWVEGSSGACLVSDTILLTELEYHCECPLYIPNAFSPNADGVNDAFMPYSPCYMEYFDMEIFDRWGNLIFRTDNTSTGWEGHANGRTAPSGMYVYWLQYRFSYQSAPETRSGAILLVR